MNPDCQYCGLKDGGSIDHECESSALKNVINNLYDRLPNNRTLSLIYCENEGCRKTHLCPVCSKNYEVLESKIKEIETLREAAGKLRDVVERISHGDVEQGVFDEVYSKFAKEALKEFDKVMGEEK